MRRVLISGIFVVFCFLTVVILAQVPQLLNYQGRLTDDAGIPITTATILRFSLYQGGDAATPGSGTLVYGEDASVTPDDNGVFSHLIGSGTVVHGTLDSTVFYIKIPVYLEITIDPAGANETLLPRKQIVTVGYSFISELAYDADKVDGEDASAFAPVGHHHDPDYVNEGQANSVNSAMIVDGTIVDADINASANIAATKINSTGLDADLLDGKDSLDFVHTTGDDMTGTLNIVTSSLRALYGTTSNASGIGFYGKATSTSGINSGVCGESVSTTGYGVYGRAPNNGVYGYASAASGTAYGLYGKSVSSSGYGVYGTAINYGVYGEANATSGTNYGVYGISKSPDGYGVFAQGVTAIYGLSAPYSGGAGVIGESRSTDGYGVYGYAQRYAGTAFGVYGRSDSTGGRGVYGYAHNSSGTNYGVYGQSRSESGYGVYGYNSWTTGTTYGVYGKVSSDDGYAGYFNGNTHVTGTFTAGTKSCVQPIDNGKKVLLYAMESPEIWFEDFGTAQLVNGQAVVQLESVFTQAANTEAGYMVFLTPIGEWKGLYISRQHKDAFEVREQGGGTSNTSFYYRIVAKRRGYEEVRFEEFTEPEQSPEEPNLPVEKK